MARKNSVRLSPATKLNAIVKAAVENERIHGEYAIVCERVAINMGVTTPVISTFLKKYNKWAAVKGKRNIGLLSRSYASGNSDSELESLISDLPDCVDSDELADVVSENV